MFSLSFFSLTLTHPLPSLTVTDESQSKREDMSSIASLVCKCVILVMIVASMMLPLVAAAKDKEDSVIVISNGAGAC